MDFQGKNGKFKEFSYILHIISLVVTDPRQLNQIPIPGTKRMIRR